MSHEVHPAPTALAVERDLLDMARLGRSAHAVLRRRADPIYSGPLLDPVLRARVLRSESAADRLAYVLEDLADVLRTLVPDLEEERRQHGDYATTTRSADNALLDLDTE